MSAALRYRMGWILATVLTLSGGQARGDEPRLADYFGFLPLEVYKLDPRVGNLILKDLDGDKTDDIVVVNNGRSRIDLLLSGKKVGKEVETAPADDQEPNQISSDRRMRLVSVPVNKEVVSLQVADFNGDGRPDLAFFGNPAELVIMLNDGQGGYSTGKRLNVGEAVENSNALTVGDLNRDGRADLALLQANEVEIVYQGEGGKLGEPERLPHTASNPQMLKAVDLDGDGGDDLVILDGGTDDPIRVRFSAPGGKLGPEQRFFVESPRAITFAQIDGKAGVELLTIEAQSGRARVLKLDEAEKDESGTRGRLIFYPLPPGNERGRSLALGDLDGDGKTDVVVTDPANAQFLLYRQSGRTGLGAGQSFPALVGGRTVRLADLDGNGKAEVIVLSEQEKQIGRSVLEEGRLTFPTPLPISGEPVALDVADLDGDKTPEVVYVARTKPNGNESFSLRGVKREASGTFVPFRWGQEDEVPLKGLTSAPPALQVLDVNRDGQPDVLVFNAFGPPLLLLGRAGGEPPAPAGGSLGPLAGVTPAGLTLADLNGPALIVAQNTFARNLVLDKQGVWEVKDQYNSGRGSAQILGAAALDVDGDGTKEIVLLDKSSKSLLFLEYRDKVYRPNGSLAVGPIDFQGMHVADLDGDGRDDLLLAGTDRFGVVLTGQKGQRLRPMASYESNRTEAKLADLAAGDLNGDGRPDIVLTDIAEHFIEIVTCSSPTDLNRAFAFKIFERKSSRGLNDMVEPRDLAVGDVDGDKRADLVLIVHDRILVYRQDPGKPADEKAK
ncbi:Repeat domain-containing protein [Singulisphaera sp. GP187]|uniref:FG-GAP repeat domain-containing protein n=1 Tax=Singulisphaera sp. GP187 TaxID=1882752 RepID=UPI000926883D|nr:VCBS repeat-containing protein [Singulisphaera sp. GP187]SIO62659.1 Repeat domain-containing protein [Singulisphaera sp. GP187]